jgi:ribosome-binding protein aMBF1 (putative translation factor)
MDKRDKYKPVKHTKEDDAKLFSDPKFKAAYDELEAEYAALDALLTARHKAGLSQAEVARRMGMKASRSRGLKRLSEAANISRFATLRKYAGPAVKSLLVKLPD